MPAPFAPAKLHAVVDGFVITARRASLYQDHVSPFSHCVSASIRAAKDYSRSMTHHENTGPESLGSYSLDDEDQLQPEDTLDDRGLDDLLDEGYSPPERPRGVDAFGTTLAEQQRRESIDQRLAHEVPDPANAFEDPLAEADM